MIRYSTGEVGGMDVFLGLDRVVNLLPAAAVGVSYTISFLIKGVHLYGGRRV